MIALDTNLLVRIATRDHPEETAVALDLIRGQAALVLDTVLLETAWTLRSRYAWTSMQLADFFDFLAQSENIELKSPDALKLAVAGLRGGLDFADALHAALSGDVPLYTLDRDFHRKAARQAGFHVRLVKS